jgi:sialic acid synthase SpsE
LRIGSHRISSSDPVFVIAELGVNHDGRVDLALRLVEIAAACGADAIKLQLFEARRLVHGEGLLAEYQKKTTDALSSVELLRRYELAESDALRVVAAARTKGLAVLATPFSPPPSGDVPLCRRLGLDAVKIASPDVVNVPLLEAVSGLGMPVLVSTGAAELDEVDDARRLLSLRGADHVLLHCVSAYPVPPGMAHLRFIPEMVSRYGELVGYSDHTESLITGALATAAGAVVIERHLTYDRSAAGPDHAASSDPEQFAQYVSLIREASTLRGTGSKRVLPIEGDVRKVSRQSLVTTRDLPAGHVLTPADLTTQRPGTGISAGNYRRTLGRRIKETQPAGKMLRIDDLAN